jgi:hypothetical protein
MFAIECTQRLLDQLDRLPSGPGAGGPTTTRLGDWCANVIQLRGRRAVLVVSMRSLLPVLVPLVPTQELLPAVCVATANVLARIGACSDEIDRELREMQEVALTRTTSRRVLGSMTDFAWLADAHERGTDLVEIALKLAEAPCRPIGMRSPRRVARELLEAGE